MSYRVESEFEHVGLKCVVVFSSMGHRCGYVGVNKNHPLYRKGRDDKLKTRNGKKTEIESYFCVHGGITYAGSGSGEYPIKSDLWWFGFDCAHFGDGNDIEIAKKLFAGDDESMRGIEYLEKMENMYPTGGVIRTREYVENECRHLAEQLAEFKVN